jgi:hypothetical protein
MLISNDYKAILFIAGCWSISWLLVSPLHDYPLNDDWSYATTVKYLVENGEYYLTDWLGGPMVTQALWGYLFSLPFGFSYPALIFSTLVIGLIGVVFAYLTLRCLGVNLRFALLISLLLALNPIYFSLSATFMTDIHFYGFFVMSIYFFIKYAANRSYYAFLIGSLAALAATFIRQFGLTITLAFLLFEIIHQRKLITKQVIYLIVANAAIVLLYVIYSSWLQRAGQLTENFRSISEIMDVDIIEMGWRIVTRTGHMLHETGFLLFPLLLVFTIHHKRAIILKPKLIAAVMAIFIFPVIRTVGDFPGGNIFNPNWIGPITTVDIFVYAKNIAGIELQALSVLFKIISTSGALMLIMILAISGSEISIKRNDAKTPDNFNGIKLYALFILILYLGIVMISFSYFDRYMIPVLLLLVIIVIPPQMKLSKKYLGMGVVYLIFLSAFSILLARDYLEFNAVKWDTALGMTDQGVHAEIIDGGHEYNGWHGASIDKMGKWDPGNYSYAISVSKLENYTVIDSVPVSLKLTPVINKFYILKNNKMNNIK